MDFQKCSDEELINMYHDGEEIAIDYIFEKYKNVVRKKARAMFLAGGDNDDLIQEGMIGLYKAVRDFDGNRDASFATFASMCINRQIITAVTASNRKKNAPLNTYVSFDAPVSTETDSDVKLVDILQSDMEQNPEKLVLDKEHTQLLELEFNRILSPLERKVLDLYLEGQDYISIATHLGREPKSIDNALQRIRNKVSDAIHKMGYSK